MESTYPKLSKEERDRLLAVTAKMMGYIVYSDKYILNPRGELLEASIRTSSMYMDLTHPTVENDMYFTFGIRIPGIPEV